MWIVVSVWAPLANPHLGEQPYRLSFNPETAEWLVDPEAEWLLDPALYVVDERGKPIDRAKEPEKWIRALPQLFRLYSSCLIEEVDSLDTVLTRAK